MLGNSSSSQQTDPNVLSNAGQSNTKLMKLQSLMTSLKPKDTALIISKRSAGTHQKRISDDKKRTSCTRAKHTVLQKTRALKPAQALTVSYTSIQNSSSVLYFKLDTRLFIDSSSSQNKHTATKRGLFIYIFNSSIHSECVLYFKLKCACLKRCNYEYLDTRREERNPSTLSLSHPSSQTGEVLLKGTI